MNIVVTGASGFVGRRLCRELAAAGHTGIAVSRKEIDLLPAGWRWVERQELLSGRVSSEAVDALVHLEVKHHAECPTEADREEFIRVNVDGTAEWLRWCDGNQVRKIVHFSTIKAVGGSKSGEVREAGIRVSADYGQSKRAAENLLVKWVDGCLGRSALILRPAVIYGPGNTANIFSMVRAIDQGIFFLVGRNDNVKSLVSIGNVVRAVEHLLRSPAPGVRIYNLIDRESFSVRQIAEMVAMELGREGPIRSIPPRLAWLGAEVGELCRRLTGKRLPLTRSRLTAMKETTHFSAEKLMATGFVHPQTTQEGLREMVAWYLDAKANGFKTLEGRSG